MNNHSIYIINLERSPHRRRTMSEQFVKQSLPHFFFTAIDGQTLDLENCSNYEGALRRARFGYDLLPNEVGCYLSHVGGVQKAWDEGLDRVTIMEDDVELHDDFAAVYEACVALPENIEMIRFSGLRERPFIEIQKLVGDYKLTRPKHGLCGAQAYMLNRTGMRKLLDYGEQIVMQYDIMIDRFYDSGLKIFSVQPLPIVVDESVESDIGSRPDHWREDKNRVLRARLKARKLRDSIKRKLHVALKF
jgi:glycosyl transferase family 25